MSYCKPTEDILTGRAQLIFSESEIASSKLSPIELSIAPLRRMFGGAFCLLRSANNRS